MSDWHRKRHIPVASEFYVKLYLPDERQRADHDCGDAALRCVAIHHQFDPKVIRRQATEQRGTSPEQIEAECKRLGMRVVSGEMQVSDLMHYCDTKRPPIVLVHWPTEDDSHYVVVAGVSGLSSRSVVYYQDPLHGPCKKNASEFLTAWKAAGRVGPYRQWAIVGWV